MKSCYNKIGWLSLLFGVMVGLLGCTDELIDSRNVGMPSDVVCFTASLSNPHAASQTRSASGHLETEQEEWLVGTEQSVSRGTPVTLLEGSAGVIGYVYETWQEYVPADGETPATKGTSPWSTLNNKKFIFDGDELTAESNNVRWNTLGQSNVRFYVYAPYNLTGGTLSSEQQGGSPQLTYTVNDTPTEQHDLIVASWEGQSNYKQSIPLTFEHALTAIKFKVGFDCKVTKLEVQGIYNSGTYTFGKGWEVNTTSADANAQPTSDYTFTFGENGSGMSFSTNAFLTDGENTLMMIPQTLGSGAKVILTYKEGDEIKTITSTLSGKVWQEGKMITYTIHKNAAPTTIYFDLAAGNVLICCTENSSQTPTETKTYSGYVYVGGERKEVTGNHDPSNVYDVYQSTGDISGVNDKTKTGWSEEIGKGECTLPNYSPVTYNDKPWADFIKNNVSVANVITAWKTTAAAANRTATNNRIRVYGSNKAVKLTIDNIYSTYAERSMSRTKAGIGFNAGNNSKLTITTIGDNRVSAIHYHGGKDKNNQLIFEGTGSLTVGAASGKTEFYNDTYVGETTRNDTTFIDNHWCSAIGGNDSGEGNSCGIVINSGNIFAGTTKAENCTAIGAGGNDKGVITINGGNVTAVATTTGTAIGGGIGFNSAGGYGIVTINGGNVYAYNHQNRWSIPSSAIGGAGSSAAEGTRGDVYIYGGYMYAYSALGTAIGGGSSKSKKGGDANVTITGGQIIAKSASGTGIGGGTGSAFENNYNGGNATVTISGNPIIRTGSIGGGGKGTQSNGTIGAASITIEENCEADIQAQFVLAAGIASSAENKFEMKGGTIRNSYADDKDYLHIQKQGGAVYLEDGTFIMSGGTIKNCSAEQGGAVYINSKSGNSTFTMTGGEIHSCFSTGTYNNIGSLTNPGHGGAVCLMGGEVNMSGGRIWNNYSESGDGGAVYISNGNFAMTHSSKTFAEGYPTITGNAAQKGNGGGVYVSSENGKSVQVDLLQGIITNNTANNYGGGICVDMGDTENSANVTVGLTGQGVTKETANPKISGNMAMMAGGGLYARGKNANITINSGMIDENKVSAYVKNENVANEKGGVTLNDGLVTHVVVTFNGNGGKVSETETYTQKIVTNTNSQLTPNRFVRNGFKFVGWNNRPDGLGEKKYTADPDPINPNQVVQVVPLSEDITLYAQWEAQK